MSLLRILNALGDEDEQGYEGESTGLISLLSAALERCIFPLNQKCYAMSARMQMQPLVADSSSFQITFQITPPPDCASPWWSCPFLLIR